MSVIFVFCLTYSSDFISIEKKKETALALPRYFSVVYFFSDGDFCVFKRF